jgi:hypothetical protein
MIKNTKYTSHISIHRTEIYIEAKTIRPFVSFFVVYVYATQEIGFVCFKTS